MIDRKIRLNKKLLLLFIIFLYNKLPLNKLNYRYNKYNIYKCI